MRFKSGSKAIWLVLIIATLSLKVAQADEGWGIYHAPEYGFSMLMPIGTRFVEREFGGGWAELRAEHEGVIFYALVKLGEQARAEEIEDVGVRLTGVPGSYWKTINEGEHENGWVWYATVEASVNGKLIFGDYGTGNKGSYLLILETTESDYQAYKSDYKAWYESIRLN